MAEPIGTQADSLMAELVAAPHAFDFRQAGGHHLANRDQGNRLVAIDPRPHAPGAAWRELLEPPDFVELPLLSVDPAPSEGDLQCLRIRDRRLPRRRMAAAICAGPIRWSANAE